MTATQRLQLPHILPGQAQKELFHNEGLELLDMLVAAAVEEGPRASPPASPVVGSCYIVAEGATGAWQGHDVQLAAFTSGGWRYSGPVEGATALVRSTGETAAYRGGVWELGTVRGSALLIGGEQVVGPQAQPIADPAGGTQVDAEARTAIAFILDALRQHGLIAS